MEAKAAVFLDKDGTLIPDIPYNVNADLITLNDGVVSGLRKLQNEFLFIIVSNQSGVAKGMFNIEALAQVEAKITELLQAEGIKISGFYYCPHHPQGTIAPYNIDCSCRKPKAGMLLNAAQEHQVDLSRSWMIGDILNDVAAGKSAGCQSILIDNGNETEWDLNSNNRKPDFMAKDFLAAADYITQNKKHYDCQSAQYIEEI